MSARAWYMNNSNRHNRFVSKTKCSSWNWQNSCSFSGCYISIISRLEWLPNRSKRLQLGNNTGNIRKKKKKARPVHGVNITLGDAFSRQMVLYHVMTRKCDSITIYMRTCRVGDAREKRSESKNLPVMRSALYYLYHIKISPFVNSRHGKLLPCLKATGLKAQWGETLFCLPNSVWPLHN